MFFKSLSLQSYFLNHRSLNFSNYTALVRSNWKEAWPDKRFRIQFIIASVYMVGVAIFYRWFFDFIEARNGKLLGDIILDFLPAHDVSWIVFFCLYSGMLISMLYMVAHPRQLLLVFGTYCLVMTMRVFSITLFPLNPPEGYIPLREPIAQLFVDDGRIISKDLFFSGHVSTIFSLFYPLKNKTLRRIVLFLSIMVGLLVLVQHVHYTIDVLMAPFATYVCYLLSKRITAKINQ